MALRPFIPTSVKLSCDPITPGVTTMRILFCHCQVLVSVPESESSVMTSASPKPGKCDRRIATLKSHMRRFINEGNDINTAKDMKVAIESYGEVKGCCATVAEIQDSFQSMKKHSMTGIQS